MAQAATKRLVVAGGNGFLGSRICRAAVARGWDVTSISRSGEPTWSSVSSSPAPPAWSRSVTWAKADILNPSTYSTHLARADAVVHTVGILLEADYKGVVQGKESLFSGLTRAFSPTPNSGAAPTPTNPLHREPTDDAGASKPPTKLTYEVMNRDTAIALAREADSAGASTFVYISAAAGAPILPARYITTKREAEATVARDHPNLRSIFMRPGFMYDASRSLTLPIAAGGMVGSTVNSLIGGRLTPLFGAAVEKPLKVDLVADAVVEAIADDATAGPVDTRLIEALAAKAWRRTML